MKFLVVLLNSVPWCHLIGKHFYRTGRFLERRYWLGFPYRWYFCDEIWACRFLLLALCLIQTEQVGAEECGLVGSRGWIWLGCKEIRWTEGWYTGCASWSNRGTWRKIWLDGKTGLAWEGFLGRGILREGPGRTLGINSDSGRGGHTKPKHWMWDPG